MNFIDKVQLKVKAGKGGDGIVAFIREKYIPKGGPGGGDGGNGASIIVEADEGLSTLLHLKYQKNVVGKDGENGANKKQHGKNAQDTIVKVPCGTIIKENGVIVADLNTHGKRVKIAQGGKGGRGNARFATSRNSTPKICENGSLGENKTLEFELIVLADVGLVGYPSVGKSTIISVISNAKPEIADYHFTTLAPKLGLVKVDEFNSFVIADLPGLIEGASQGKGLGIRFLKHINRCRVILHVLDASSINNKELADDFRAINKELEQFDPKLLEKETIVVVNKIDDPVSKEKIAKFKKEFPEIQVMEISAIKKQGIDHMIQTTFTKLKNIKKTQMATESKSKHVDYLFESKNSQEIVIHNKGNGLWIVEGQAINNALQKNPMNTEQNQRRFYQLINKLRVEDKLLERGAKTGDTIKIGDLELELS